MNVKPISQKNSGIPWRQPSWIWALATLLLLGSFSTTALADPSREDCLNSLNNSQAKLLRCITQDGLRIHAEKL